MARSHVLEGLDAAWAERLEREADRAVALRALPGTMLPGLIAVAFTVALRAEQRLRGPGVALTAALILVGFVRAALSRNAKRPDSQIRRVPFAIATTIGMALFGVYVAMGFHVLDVSVDSALMLVATAGVITGASHVFAPRKRLMQACLASVVLPPMIALLWASASSRFLLIALLWLVLVYSLLLGARIHTEYWKYAIASARLTQHGQALDRSRDQLQQLISKSPDAIGIVRDGRIVFVNPAWAAGLRYDANELVGRPVTSLAHPEDAVALDRITHATDPSSAAREIRLFRKDGDAITWEIAPSQAIDDFEGGRAQVLVARDVTERNRMREQLVLTERLAALGTLAAGVAHEINNPLTYVLGNLELLATELPRAHAADFKELERALSDARQGAERVRDIVRDLKSYSRAERPQARPVDVERALALALKMAASTTRLRARVVQELDTVPLVVADEGKLQQVFLNLIMNAAQAIPEGRAEANTITIATEVTPRGDVLVRISDTGAGIAREHLTHIFDPFFTTKPVGVGTGLGLFICHRLVRAFGGDISVESELGRGTTFTVLLRRATESFTKLSTVPPSSVTARTNHRILVIDDDIALGHMLERSLGQEHDVVFESDAARACARLLKGERFDLVLCDLMMPGLTGMELHESLTHAAPEMAPRIVFMTGGVFTDAARSFLERVPNVRISKPFELRKLRALVAECLAKPAEEEPASTSEPNQSSSTNALSRPSASSH